MKSKIKNIITRSLAVLLCAMLLSNTLFSIDAYAAGTIVEDFINNALWNDPFGKANESMEYFLEYLLAQYGVITNGSYEDVVDNTTDYLDNIKSVWTPENIQMKTDSNGKKSLVFNKVVADALLKGLKEAGKKPDNGGYELVKTVPVSKISRLYFDTNEQYSTLFNLLKDNNGIVGLYVYSGYSFRYCKVDANCVWVKGDFEYSDSSGKHKFYTAVPYKTLNSSMFYEPYGLTSADVVAKNWEDTENLQKITNTYHRVYNFQLYDSFSYMVDSKSAVNPLSKGKFLITNSGATIPVFNTLDDAVAYSVANNLYYTTSDFTGEGQEVVIDYDELDKVLSGYYSGMYDMLQRLIEQNGGNALTPEQVQALADQVAESFDMLKAEINKGFEEQDALIQANSNILKAIKSVMEKKLDEIKKVLEDMLETLKKLKNWTAVNTVLEGLDLLADLADFIKDFFSDVTKGVSSLALGFSDIVELMSEKFPFSIPWDIYALVSNLAETPETPVFEIPLKLSRYGIDEKFVIDFSHFEIISKISRSLLSMIYATGLLKLTDKIISSKKGGAV